MYNQTKKVLATVLAMSFTTLGVSASEVSTGATAASTGTTNQAAQASFSVTEVKAVKNDTLNIVFDRELLDNTEFFEFVLTPKSDDTKDILLSNLKVIPPYTVEATTAEPLNVNEEYNFVVVFASDKEGHIIENGVDGMVTFTTPAVFPEVTEDMNAASEVTTTAIMADSTTSAVDPTTTTGAVDTTDAAASAEALPQTGPAEFLFVLLALLLGVGVMFIRKKA